VPHLERALARPPSRIDSEVSGGAPSPAASRVMGYDALCLA
jgi:hypothetical protein